MRNKHEVKLRIANGVNDILLSPSVSIESNREACKTLVLTTLYAAAKISGNERGVPEIYIQHLAQVIGSRYIGGNVYDVVLDEIFAEEIVERMGKRLRLKF